MPNYKPWAESRSFDGHIVNVTQTSDIGSSGTFATFPQFDINLATTEKSLHHPGLGPDYKVPVGRKYVCTAIDIHHTSVVGTIQFGPSLSADTGISALLVARTRDGKTRTLFHCAIDFVANTYLNFIASAAGVYYVQAMGYETAA